jgi:hypothetical protein
MFSAYTSPFVLWSPNINNVGGNYYCVYGRRYCRGISAGWLDKSGRVGWPLKQLNSIIRS